MLISAIFFGEVKHFIAHIEVVRRSFGTINIFAAGSGVIYCPANSFISIDLYFSKKHSCSLKSTDDCTLKTLEKAFEIN